MELETLNEIYNSYNKLYKEAAAGTAASIMGALDATNKIIDAGKDIGSVAFKAYVAPLLLSAPFTAGAASIVASKMTSPEALAANADKYILRAALDSEIAVMERKIAEEELRRQKTKEKKYDRFI